MRALAIVMGICFSGFLFSCKNERLPYRILYVNSYHEGYPPSDAVTDALLSGLPKDSFEVRTIYLDTKRRTDEVHIDSAVREVLDILGNGNFSALLVSDDAAVQYVVSPNQKRIEIPVVYCGVNWSAQSYQLDETRVAGMLEVLPLDQLLADLKTLYPAKGKLWILSERSLSEDQNTRLLDTLYRNAGFNPTYRLVNNFTDWERAFLNGMDSADVVYLPTNGAIREWDAEKAREVVSRNIRKPVVTCDDFMMPYCVYGLTKVPAEQGQFLANAVRQLTRGKLVQHIGTVKNSQSEVWYNPKLAAQTGFPEPPTPGYNTVNEIVANVPDH